MLKIFPKYLNFENISKKCIRVPGPLEAIPEAVFVKQELKNKPEQITSQGTQSNAVSSFNYEKMVGDGFQMMWKIAKCLRNEVLTHKWTFEGDIKDYTVPPLL